MTTAQTQQTLLTPSTRSAGIVRSRAEFPSQSAADAPGFAGVLEAFAEPIEDTQLDQESQPSDDADQSESQDPENADQSEKTEQPSADDTQANTQNTPVEGSAAEGTPSDLVPDADNSINSTADLESLLTNAAAIDSLRSLPSNSKHLLRHSQSRSSAKLRSATDSKPRAPSRATDL